MAGEVVVLSSWRRAWALEERSEVWQAAVTRVHGADAVDNHGLSVPDAERIVDAVFDELRAHGVEVK